MRDLALLLMIALVAACAPAPPDSVLVNARVFTADPAHPWAEAVAIRGERVIAVGSTADVAPLAGPRTLARDLAGRVVLPGFNDAHVADPRLTGPALREFVQAAVGSGITSMQWFVGERTVQEAGTALVDGNTPMRFRVLRMPRPGPDGGTIDSRPHLPPQPSNRIDIRGMGFALGDGEAERLRQAVGWAYGSEDLLAVEPGSDTTLGTYIDAVEQSGVAEVWVRKRPRVERAGPAAIGLAPRLRAQGMVVVQRPDRPLPLASLLRQDVRLALASGDGRKPFALLAWATSPEREKEALSMEEAIGALTRGAAYAEFTDREKGTLSVGALADLTVPSVDPFTASPEQLRGARSVLTLIGGRPVHDVP